MQVRIIGIQIVCKAIGAGVITYQNIQLKIQSLRVEAWKEQHFEVEQCGQAKETKRKQTVSTDELEKGMLSWKPKEESISEAKEQ